MFICVKRAATIFAISYPNFLAAHSNYSVLPSFQGRMSPLSSKNKICLRKACCTLTTQNEISALKFPCTTIRDIVKGAAKFDCTFHVKCIPRAYNVSCWASFGADQSLYAYTPPSQALCEGGWIVRRSLWYLSLMYKSWYRSFNNTTVTCNILNNCRTVIFIFI